MSNVSEHTQIVTLSSCLSQFFNTVLSTDEVSFRLVAESEALKEKLKRKGKLDEASIVKLQVSNYPNFEERIELSRSYNELGYAVFYLPQKFHAGYSETYSEIEEYRAIVIDLDGAPISKVYELALELPYTAIIESSEGKFQVVYRIKDPENVEGSDKFNEVAAGLGAYLDADLNAAKATQPFRCPLFKHWKKTPPSTSQLTQLQNIANSWHELVAFFNKNVKGIRSSLSQRQRNNGGYSPQALDKCYFGPQIDLNSLFLGEVKISAGERHSTILRVQTRLLHAGCTEEEVMTKVDGIIESSFLDAKSFLPGGERRREVETSLRCAKMYTLEAKRQEKSNHKEHEKRYMEAAEKFLGSDKLKEAARERARETTTGDNPLTKIALKYEKEAQIDEALKSSPSEVSNNGHKPKKGELNSGFDYDFEVGTLRHNRYTESGIVDRALQRFSDDLARIDKRVWCYSGVEKCWKVQNVSSGSSEVQARIMACVKDAISEKEFLHKFVNKKGELNLKAKENAEAQLLKASAVSSMTRCLINSMAVPRYSLGEFDAKEHIILCKNGVLDMTTGQLREAKNTDLLMNRCSVEWDESAKCPQFLEFLSQVFEENLSPKAMIKFMQQLFGYSISGSTSEEKIFCHLGSGGNGKSKIMQALRALTGAYSTGIEPEELISQKKGYSVKFERLGAKIEGKRIAIIDDLDVGGTWNEGFVKTLTAKSVRCRAEYELSREAVNRCKFHLGLNVAPEPQAENIGIIRRLCIIPYNRQFSPNFEKERELSLMIETEAPGILVWAVEGYRQVLIKGGLEYPAETLAAVSEYRREHFHVEAAIDDLFLPASDYALDGADWSPLSEMAQEVNEYFEVQGRYGMRITPTILGKALKQKMGFKSEKKYDPMQKNTVSHYLIIRKREKESST
jgi:P4 family phage/plasmid primase-like protien